MSGQDSPELPLELERFRRYLQALARMGLEAPLRGKVEPSDIVQQTLLEAHASRALFRGHTAEEEAAWLRKILLQNILDAERALTRKKRDAGRERSLEAVLAESTTRFEGWLKGDEPSPSEQVLRQERILSLAEALASLPKEEQEVLLMRHCRGLGLAEIGRELRKSRYAVARLLHRGIKALREKIKRE